MNCAQSVELMSDFQAGTLEEAEGHGVRLHLTDCPPCAAIMNELLAIIGTATLLRRGETTSVITFPDENVIWQRVRASLNTTH